VQQSLTYCNTLYPTRCTFWVFVATHWNTLQHTLLKDGAHIESSLHHCNKLQHIAAHSNSSTLQYTTTHRNTLNLKMVHNPSLPCNTLQHTATNCNTLQHTATHCNTLQNRNTTQHTLLKHGAHTNLPCNTLWHAAAHCSTQQHTATHSTRNTLYCKVVHIPVFTATHCNTMQRTHCTTLQHTPHGRCTYRVIPATHCNTLQHSETHCNTLYSKMVHVPSLPCNTLQHTATRCNTLQHTLLKDGTRTESSSTTFGTKTVSSSSLEGRCSAPHCTVGTSHGTRMNESWTERVMDWTSHGTHVKWATAPRHLDYGHASWHTYEWVMDTCKWVQSHTGMGHVPHVK